MGSQAVDQRAFRFPCLLYTSILGNRVFDLGLFYQVGGYNEQIMNLFRNNKTDFTSMYETYKNSALAKLDEINAAFAEVE